MENVEASRSVFSNFRAIFVGRLVASLSTWMSLVVLAKMADPLVVGTYALAQAICMPVAEVAKMGLREARSSDTRDQFIYGNYLALRIIATFAAFLLIVAIAVFQLDGLEVFLVIVLYGMNRCAWLLSDILYAHFQRDERMDLIGNSLMIVGPLSLLFLFVGYYVTASLVVATFAQLVAYALVLLLFDLPNARRRGAFKDFSTVLPSFEPAKLKALALQVVPLVFSTLLLVVALFYPRVRVEMEFGLSSLGIYAAILALSMAPVRLVTSLGVATSVRLARLFSNRQFAAFKGLLLRMEVGVALAGVVAVALAMIFGPALLEFIYTDAYAAHSDILVWLVAAATVRVMANLLQFGVIASRKFWWLCWQNGVMLVVSVLGCIFIIPAYGIAGAGLVMLTVFCAQLLAVLAGIWVILRFSQR